MRKNNLAIFNFDSPCWLNYIPHCIYFQRSAARSGKITYKKGFCVDIEVDPFFIDATRDVKTISDPFLKKSGLSYFQYCSVFNDESSNFLVTHPEFAMDRARTKKRILSHIDKTQINNQTYMFLWNESLPKEDTDMARDYGIDNGLCFVERFKDHYNLIAFGAPVGVKVNNFYLNNISKLWGFVEEFKARGADLIQDAVDRRFQVPESCNDVNREQLFLKKSRSIQTIYNGVHIFLSEKEFESLKLVSQGFTMKGISIKMQISSRTVETYLNRVKSKVGLFTKQDLAQFFHSNFGGNIS